MQEAPNGHTYERNGENGSEIWTGLLGYRDWTELERYAGKNQIMQRDVPINHILYDCNLHFSHLAEIAIVYKKFTVYKFIFAIS